MAVVGVVQVSVDEVTDVVAVGHGFVTAAGSVYVVGRMAAALVVGGACVGVFRRDLDAMLVDVVTVRMMKVAIVEVVDVPVVPHAGVTAVLIVLVGVVLVLFAAHGVLSLSRPGRFDPGK